tara:strand:+ start:1181 stop:3046 length:1866 start_codon:yes stop_codon:yes gene_type:complete
MSITTETLFLEEETANSKQIDILKKNFPQFFDKNSNFLPEKMAELMQANNVNIVKESYGLNWLGKSYARLLTNLPPQQLMKANHTHNELEKNKNSQNVLIKGDNLEVLKHLANAYRESVKMIYIDPPYNTGSDGFVYKDDFKFTSEQLMELAGIDKEEANRILEFTEKGSNSHSSWLTFMYPRLYIARGLLKESGVIYISIDDNQQAQLKLLCDEVFGEENFIKDLIVNTSEGGGNAKYVVNGHETVLVYAKNIMYFDNLKRPKDIRGKKVVINNELYWIQEDAVREVFGEYGNLHYEDILTVRDEAYKRKIDLGIENNEYILVEKSSGKHIIGKLRKVSDDFSKFHSILNIGKINKHLTANGIREIEALFDSEKGKSPFDNPKPLDLLRTIVLSSTFKGNEKDIVLDFFVGSGTTAHAVMKLNAEDNGNRQFIAIQIDQPTDVTKEAYKAGYETIFEITKERISKAAQEIKDDNPDYQGDLGFKIFETTNDFRVKADNTLDLDNPSFFNDVQLTDEQYQSLLTTWQLYDGSKLTAPVCDIVLNDYTAHLCKGRLYLIAPNFTVKNISALLERLDSDKEFSPNKIIIYGSNFDSANQMELNEALKSYGNKKSIDISLIVRY